MTIRNKIYLLLVTCFFSVKLQAQKQQYKAALGAVPETGFYEIAITPELSAYLKTDLSDLRIAGEKNSMVPYIIRNNRFVAPNVPSVELPVTENKIVDSGRSQIILQNKTGKSIRTLLITAGNTAVRRKATLSGSNDGKNWYIIHNEIFLEPSFATGTSDRYTQQAGIPATNYTWLKLVVDNEHADPVHIIKIAIPADETIKPQAQYIYKENPQITFTQKDSSNGNSYITIHSKEPYHTDLVHVLVATPRFYDRQVALRAPANDTTEHCASCNEIMNFNLNSSGRNSAEINRFKSRVMQLVIANGDNPPIQVREIKTFQRAYSAVAWLEKGKSYNILADDPAAARPQYDLEHFTDSIPALIRSLSFEEIKPVKNGQTITLPAPAGGRKIWLWATIVAAIFLLAVFTWRLIKDMKQKGM